MTKVMIGETEYNRLYLIEFNGKRICVTPILLTDKEFDQRMDTNDEVVPLQDDNFIILTCIGSSYSSIINEEAIEAARKNAIEWFTRQVGYAKENLKVNELRLKQAMTAKLDIKEER